MKPSTPFSVIWEKPTRATINPLKWEDDPPLYLRYNGDLTVPSKDKGHGIHHGLFGVKMKEKSEKVGHNKVYLTLGKNADKKYRNGDDFVLTILLGENYKAKK